MRPFRKTAAAVLMVFVASLIAPVVVEAQSYEFDIPAEADSSSYVADVTGRLSTKDALEDQWTRASQRQQAIQDQIARIEQAQAAGGRSDDWYERAAAQLRKLREDLSQNDTVVARTQERLGKVYQQLERDRQTVSRSQDPGIRQELGTMVGVAGVAAVPIWSRPTAGQLVGAAGQAARVANLATVNARIPAYNNWAASAGTRAANAQAALGNIQPTRWVPQASGGANSAGQLVLRRHAILPDGSTGGFIKGNTVNTGIPARYQAADGSWHQNTNGYTHANDLASLQNSRTSIQNNINKLRLEASQATNTKVKSVLESRATALEGKKAQLEGNIQQYRSQNPSLGQQVKAVGVNAAKWAALSAGITVATNTITQLSRNGWDPSKIDWREATAQLRDKRFWGGVGGSFVGSYGASLIASALPGGAFVKALFAVGGAAIGWQAGSGQLGNTDWVRLGVGTLGATVGILIGTALGGPIGAFIGGIVGQLAADFILNKVRDLLIKEVPADASYGSEDRPGYSSGDEPYSDPASSSGSGDYADSGYSGSSPADTGYGSGGTSGGGSYDQAQQIAEERARVYQEMIELQSAMKTDPRAFQQFVAKQREYDQLSRQLQAMRSGSDIRQSK